MRLKLTLLILCIIPLSLSACWGDRVFVVKGTVYEWVDAPFGATSETFLQEWKEGRFIGEEIDVSRSLMPTCNASLSFILSSDIVFDPILSDSKGNYVFSTTGPAFMGEVSIYVEITKDGYFPVVREFIDSGEPHTLNIILVRKSNISKQ